MNDSHPRHLPRLRPQRLGAKVGHFRIEYLSHTDTPWHEDAADIRKQLAWGRKKAHLLKWVESQMFLRLTPTERRCIDLYYFRGLNYRDAAAVLGVNPSSVYRGVQRGLRKLREAARQNPGLRL